MNIKRSMTVCVFVCLFVCVRVNSYEFVSLSFFVVQEDVRRLCVSSIVLSHRLSLAIADIHFD